MRDKRMSLDYFNSYIDYQEERIRRKTAKLLDCNGNSMKKERINRSLLIFKTDMVYALFSAGADKDRLSKYLEEALNTASQVNNIDYETMINLFSLSVMTDTKKGISELIKKHEEMVHSDKLLNCFAKYIDSGMIVWNGEFIVKRLYDSLDKLEKVTDKESVMIDYLANWYDAHRDFAWYDSHKNGKDTYVGYWSFECAALVKVMRLDERKLKDNEYYPSL